MLAFSVREALREAVRGVRARPGTASTWARPPTPERSSGRSRRRAAAVRTARTPGRGPRVARAERCTGSRRSPSCAATRQPGVLVTVTDVRGHAPREAGAKMVVGRRQTLGHDRRRQPRGRGGTPGPRAARVAGRASRRPSTTSLTDKAPAQHGVQCCGGEVTRAARAAAPSCPPSRSSGWATSASSWPASWPATTSSCTWSTPAPSSSTPSRLARATADALARVHVHHVPVLPELVLGELPPGTHVLVMTHDHAEDAALCDAALRLRPPRLDRADRVVGEVGAVREEARRRGARPGRRSPGSRTPIGLPGDHRQGPGDDRGRRRGGPAAAASSAEPHAAGPSGAGGSMTIFRGTFLDTPRVPFAGGRLRAEADCGIARRATA